MLIRLSWDTENVIDTKVHAPYYNNISLSIGFIVILKQVFSAVLLNLYGYDHIFNQYFSTSCNTTKAGPWTDSSTDASSLLRHPIQSEANKADRGIMQIDWNER